MKYSIWKKIYILILLVILIPSFVHGESILKHQEEVAPGVIRHEYQVKNGNTKSLVNVLKVDLRNPKIKVNTVAGGGTYTNKATVSQMGNRTNAVGLVNGDFFTMQLQGAPMGSSVINSDIKSSPAVLTDIYSLGIDKSNRAYIERVGFQGKVTAPNGKSYNIDGLNKTFYWYQPNGEYSHESRIQMYNDFWSSKSRGDKTAGEVLLSENNVVEKIQYRKNLDMVIPKGKKILQVSGGSERFIRDNVKVGDRLNIQYQITPDRNWKMMIGGHALLVDNGVVKKYTKDVTSLGGVRARTAAGISKDGNTLYIVAVEGRTKRSAGMSLHQLATFMVDLGADKAINLDGGGSTAMVIRNLGDLNRTRVINPERNGSERRVVNGLGVYNITKNTGIIHGIKYKGPQELLLGQGSDFSISKAWDEHLNPIDFSNKKYLLTDNSEGKNIVTGTQYLGLVPGEFQLNYQFDDSTVSKPIKVLDPSAYKNLQIRSERKVIEKGADIPFKITSSFNGKEVGLSPRVFEYIVEGMDAQIDKISGILQVQEVTGIPKLTIQAGDQKASVSFFDKNAKVIRMNIGNKNYWINDEKKTMDVSPFIKNERTYIPLRFVAEALGKDVTWDSKTQIVTINDGNQILEIQIGHQQILIDGKAQEIDTPAFISKDRTFVPIRFIAEGMGLDVSYEPTNREVLLVEGPKDTSEQKPLKNQSEPVEQSKVEDDREDDALSEAQKNDQNTVVPPTDGKNNL
ncbi:MAG: stalk domain-containing protein [Tissierellia bacterium]|nr:stalk domain-containing protein [Tissierellia bacterium]